MIKVVFRYIALVLLVGTASLYPSAARATGNINNINHIIIVMQENHSFDNYFGALPFAPGTPYHNGPCEDGDHSCVDGLSCTRTDGSFTCTNFNRDSNGAPVFAFHDNNYCPKPDLNHEWNGSHQEANFSNPNKTLTSSPNNGFVQVNDATPPQQILRDTMGFYNEVDVPFYYALAQTFAIDDRYFCSVLGPTFPNRAYEMAATSFGHLTTNEIFPPGVNPFNPFLNNNSDGYKPITGSIFDLLDAAGITWLNYFEDLPTSPIFRGNRPPFLAAHVRPVNVGISFGGNNFFTDAANGTLPQVSFIDPSFLKDQLMTAAGPVFVPPGTVGAFETDEHPPFDIRAGEFVVSQIVSAVRSGPNWKDSLILITYDEHGGSYDHVGPPAASQGGALNPDGIDPGQCADLSNPPASTLPGGGANCFFSQTFDAPALCPNFKPTGSYPANCANFNQLGFRVPFIAISPFSKPHYVSHTVGDHTSMLALIEARFLKGQNLTARDGNANPLLDMFDFDNSPSLTAPVPTSGTGSAPAPSPTDGNGTSCL